MNISETYLKFEHHPEDIYFFSLFLLDYKEVNLTNKTTTGFRGSLLLFDFALLCRELHGHWLSTES